MNNHRTTCDPERIELFLEQKLSDEEQSAFDKFVVGEQQDLRLDKPYGIAIHDGKLYVCDTNATVMVLDLVSKRYGGLRGAAGPGKLIEPINISIEPDGT